MRQTSSSVSFYTCSLVASSASDTSAFKPTAVAPTVLAQARHLLGSPALPSPEAAPRESWQHLLRRLTGRDPNRCPYCERGTLRIVASKDRSQHTRGTMRLCSLCPTRAVRLNLRLLVCALKPLQPNPDSSHHPHRRRLALVHATIPHRRAHNHNSVATLAFTTTSLRRTIHIRGGTRGLVQQAVSAGAPDSRECRHSRLCAYGNNPMCSADVSEVERDGRT